MRPCILPGDLMAVFNNRRRTRQDGSMTKMPKLLPFLTAVGLLAGCGTGDGTGDRIALASTPRDPARWHPMGV